MKLSATHLLYLISSLIVADAVRQKILIIPNEDCMQNCVLRHYPSCETQVRIQLYVNFQDFTNCFSGRINAQWLEKVFASLSVTSNSHYVIND